MVKTFECGGNVPVRTAKFIARKHWIVAGAVCPDFEVAVYVPLLFLHKSFKKKKKTVEVSKDPISCQMRNRDVKPSK